MIAGITITKIMQFRKEKYRSTRQYYFLINITQRTPFSFFLFSTLAPPKILLSSYSLLFYLVIRSIFHFSLISRRTTLSSVNFFHLNFSHFLFTSSNTFHHYPLFFLPATAQNIPTFFPSCGETIPFCSSLHPPLF